MSGAPQHAISHATDPGYPPVAPAPPAQVAIDKLPEPVRVALSARYAEFVAWLRHPCTLRFLAFSKIQAMEALGRAADLNRPREARDLDAAAAAIQESISRGVFFQKFYEAQTTETLALALAEMEAEKLAQEVLLRKPEAPGQPERQIPKGFGGI